jgi:hypothetical protein
VVITNEASSISAVGIEELVAGLSPGMEDLAAVPVASTRAPDLVTAEALRFLEVALASLGVRSKAAAAARSVLLGFGGR